MRLVTLYTLLRLTYLLSSSLEKVHQQPDTLASATRNLSARPHREWPSWNYRLYSISTETRHSIFYISSPPGPEECRPLHHHLHLLTFYIVLTIFCSHYFVVLTIVLSSSSLTPVHSVQFTSSYCSRRQGVFHCSSQ